MCRYRHNVDNGSAFVDAWLLRACAKLGIRLIHSTPGRPAGPRQDRTLLPDRARAVPGRDHRRAPSVRRRHPVADLGELNALFTAWVETVYHRQIHSETGQAPLARWSAGGPFPLPTPDALAEAFLWEEHRTVTKTALVSLQGNTYQVDPLLVGRRVELVFDPFDLTRIAGPAPRRPGRHRDPAPDRAPRPPQGPTRDPTRAAGADRDRLRPPRRRRPPRQLALAERRQLRRPRRQPSSSPASSTCSPATTSPAADLLTDARQR